MLSHLFITALRLPQRKGLIFWLSFVMFNCVFVTFPYGIFGQMWYLIVLIPDLCHLFLTLVQRMNAITIRIGLSIIITKIGLNKSIASDILNIIITRIGLKLT